MPGSLRAGFERNRPMIGKLVFEVVIVFIGVTAAFALESARQHRHDTAYRKQMIAALIPILDDTIRHNREFEGAVTQKLSAFDRGLALGQHPALPVYREPGSERPPTRVWDGIVSTGAANDLDPKLFFDLARYYTRLDSFGERYIRYNDFTEQRVFSLGADQQAIYDERTGRLKPEYAAYVDRLRDLKELARELDKLAIDLKIRLEAQR